MSQRGDRGSQMEAISNETDGKTWILKGNLQAKFSFIEVAK